MIDARYDSGSLTVQINDPGITTSYDPDRKLLKIIGMYPIPDEPDRYMGDYSGVDCGFLYNGIHSETYHVEYIPDASDRWFDGTDWNVYQAETEWKNGGYYYGNSAKVKIFKLKCFFEEITTQQREDIRKWLHRDTSGVLMFDDMPFVYWRVRPTKLIPGQLYNDSGLYSGTFEVELSAFDPFGYLARKSNGPYDVDNAGDYCDLIPASEMPAEPTVFNTTFDVYNAGREKCGLTIKISGTTSNPIEFLNETNKTRCIIQRLPANGLILDINGDSGVIKTYVSTNPNNSESGYVYHDRGFVSLEPGLNHIRIMEKNAAGTWVTPTTLNMTSIAIDYAPRIL